MFDLIVKNANLPDGRRGMAIGVTDGRIAAVEPAIHAETAEVIDATGCLVSPPFVDSHFHMDATLSYGLPRVNQSGTLLEGIALWGELKPLLTVEAIRQRAEKLCHWAIARGTLAIRSHVDVCDSRLLAVEALLEVREQFKSYIDLQLVAFPQDGVLRSDGAMENLKRALDMGVDVIGGIPHFERTMDQGAESIRQLCELAATRGLMVDMHCDESDDPWSRHIETLTYHTQRLGLHGRVTGSHLTSMHSMDNYYVSKLLPLMAEARVHAVANPLINITLQGRHDTYPKRRGLTRVREMLAAGINVAFGHDCVMDLVQLRLPRHAGGGPHGPARGPDDRHGRDPADLRYGDGQRRPGPGAYRLRHRGGLPGRHGRAAGRRRPRRHSLAPGTAFRDSGWKSHRQDGTGGQPPVN
nr:cytosine deaminase [Desulfosarcina cetonica]